MSYRDVGLEQEVVARSTLVAGGPADEIREQPEQHERPLGSIGPCLEATFRSKSARGRWLERRRWRYEASAPLGAHPTRLALAVVIR
jgi:hypothetical protein